MLRRNLGLPYNLTLESIPNPALEPGDPIRVRYPVSQRRRGLRDEHHIIEQLTVPLTADGAMTALTREQTLVQIGTL